MSEFGNNFSFNLMPIIKNLGKQLKEALNPQVQLTKNINQNQNKPIQSLVQTNSNIVINQSTQTSPGVNQAALNATNIPKTNLNQEIKNTSNFQVPSTPSQLDFHGPGDLPAYAGIANMSLKSWIAEHDTNMASKLEAKEKQLTTTLEGIKGFQRQNYEGQEEGSHSSKQSTRNKNLIILSHMFSCMEQSGAQETELLVNIMNFRKLGSSFAQDNKSKQEELDELKLSPPLPVESNKLEDIDVLQIKYLHQLLTLPNEFPECLRLFAKDKIEINPKELNTFLVQRLKLIQEKAFESTNLVSKEITNFIPLVNQNDYSALLPLILLYYPLPLPYINSKFDFVNEWLKKKKDKGSDKSVPVIATCEIYYTSKQRGRFLIKLELNEKLELSFDIQTSRENNGVIRDLELAIAESMYLLEHPPLLSDLNILLTEEIYKATDLDEELSIVSTGPLRLEIILAAYSVLVILNKISNEPDPSGIIDIIE